MTDASEIGLVWFLPRNLQPATVSGDPKPVTIFFNYELSALSYELFFI